MKKGFEAVREKIKDNTKYTRNCLNCRFYYKDVGDDEELCQNDDVLSYDIVVEEGRVYCYHWKVVK
jgi:hypothetical protein